MAPESADTDPAPDWLGSVDEWAAYLRLQQWPLGIADELRLHALADELRRRDVAITAVDDVARWFGPLLCNNVEQQRRLPELLSTWQSVQPAADPLPPDLVRVARGVLSQPRVNRWAVWWLGAVMTVLLGLGWLGWKWLVREPQQGSAQVQIVAAAADGLALDTRVTGVLLWSIPFALALAVRRLRRRRSRVLMRGIAPRDAPRDALRFEWRRFGLYTLQALRAPVADLRRHRLVDAPWIDGARSARATVCAGGRPTLVHGKRRALPEYLLLVDLKQRDDILGPLASMLVDLLEAGDVRVERFDFSGDPRRLRRMDQGKAAGGSIELDALRATCPEHRVLVLSDGSSFADERGENLRSWVQALRAWSEVVLLTPLPPPQWGPRERALGRLGILVAEATPAGLGALARELREDRPSGQSFVGAASASAAAGQATWLDRRLGGDPYYWLGDSPPSSFEQARLLQELDELLGARAFLYLQALAVFPQVHPRLTLALGRTLGDAQGLALLGEDTLALLCRVPWLRVGRLPDWLRLALLRALRGDVDDDRRVRAAWATLLAPLPDGADALDTLPLQVVRTVDPALPPLVVQTLIRSDQRHGREALLIAFLNGDELPELAVAVSPTALKSRQRAADFRVEAMLGAALLIFALAGAVVAPLAWSAEIANRLQLIDGLWTLAACSGMLCVIAWYLRELGPLARGRRAQLSISRTSQAVWNFLPEASAIATLTLGLAAAQLGLPDRFFTGRLLLTVTLVIWCFLGRGRTSLRWAPVLWALQVGLRFEFEPVDGRSLSHSLSGGLLALVLLAWLARRHRWDDLRALLWLTLPVTIVELDLARQVSVGQGPGAFAVMWLVAHFLSDADFRRRWLAPQALDWPAVLVLLLPLAISAGVEFRGIRLHWLPMTLMLLAMFFAGLTVPRSWRWLMAITPVWLFILIASLNMASLGLPTSSDLIRSSFTVTSPAALISGLMAWAFGRLSRPAAHTGLIIFGLLLAFGFGGFALELLSFDGSRRVRSNTLFYDSVLVLALVPACLHLSRVQLAFGLFIGLGASTLLSVIALAVQFDSFEIFGLSMSSRRLSLSPLILLPSLIAVGFLVRPLHALYAVRVAPADNGEVNRLRLRILDWGLYGPLAAAVAVAAIVGPIAWSIILAYEPWKDLYFRIAVLSAVGGLTEFLPISSTGHLILIGTLLDFTDQRFRILDIAIQTGATLAVFIVYWQRLRDAALQAGSVAAARRFVLNVLIGFLPAAVLGMLVYKAVKAYLFNGPVVAASFIAGGLIILWAERRQAPLVRVQTVDDMSMLDALKVGLMQCLAMIPGTSRSGATIIGGMLLGLSRKAATDFSLLVALPTLIGASVYSLYSLYKERSSLAVSDGPMFAVGFVVSFLFAWICVRWLLRYIASHTFAPFGWYRIGFGLLVILTDSLRWVAWTVWPLSS